MKKEEVILVEDTNEPSVEKCDLYQGVLKFEDEEVKSRTEEEDQEQFGSICRQIRQWMKEISKLKDDKPENWSSDVESKRVQILMQMLSLRRISRIQKVRVKESREGTVEARQAVDGVTLKLQNLLYEVSHLNKEVRRCLDFESADKEIDLVPIKQFYKEAPESICRTEETVDNPHEQRLAQLHWELEQRRGQTQLFDQLTQEKEKVAAIITDQETKLSSLAPRINAILEVTRPLQTALNLPLDEKKEQEEHSHFLPHALYTLWVQASAYQEACDQLLSVEILGDLDAARKLIALCDDEKAEASDSETEVDPHEDNLTRKSRNKSTKIPSDSENKENSLQQLLHLHPLNITLTVKTKEKDVVVVKCYYATNLKIITTKCSVMLSGKTRSSLINVLEGESLLDCLFPDDFGTSSPNPSNLYQLNKMGLTRLQSSHLSVIGKPYKWAQSLAGLSFIDPNPRPTENGSARAEDLENSFEKVDLEDENEAPSLRAPPPKPASESISWRVSAEHMHSIVRAVRNRLQARTALHNNLFYLENANNLSSVPLSKETLEQYFPRKISSELRSWRPITFQDYTAQPCTKAFIDAGFVKEGHFTFKGFFERKAVKLDAFVAISPDYPNVAPIFALALKWDEHLTNTISSQIQQMESEINIHCEEMVSNKKEKYNLISLQLYRLAMCLDILTEAITAQSAGKESQPTFHKEKIFFRAARGPDRALPFKYLPKLGVFAQR